MYIFYYNLYPMFLKVNKFYILVYLHSFLHKLIFIKKIKTFYYEQANFSLSVYTNNSNFIF